jgi:UDP-N-acetylglucosamine:LPS N-acetylglucosamine transferase
METTTFERVAAEAEAETESRERLLLVCSSGGHLSQLAALRPWWERHDRLWVTFDKPDARSILAGERVAWAHHPTTRNIPNAVRNLGLAHRVIEGYRPTIVVSTGAGVAVPFFLSARRARVSTIYIEVYDRLDSATLTGRLCYPLSDLFLLQWPEQRRFYPNGIVIGRLL